MTDDTGGKKEKGLSVCFPGMDSTREEKDVAIKILDNYITNYEREDTESVEVDHGGHTPVDAKQ